jgi:hypothetical protein
VERKMEFKIVSRRTEIAYKAEEADEWKKGPRMALS